MFAPAYDLVFSYGPGGEQSMLVMGEGRNPGAAQLQALGKQHGIKNAQEILAKVKTAVANWRRYAEQADSIAKIHQRDCWQNQIAVIVSVNSVEMCRRSSAA